MTLAERYNLEATRLLPHMAADLQVDPAITRATEIDEIVFRRGEFLGGMACAILAMIADTMIPEAFETAHEFAGLITVCGFLTAFALSRWENA